MSRFGRYDVKDVMWRSLGGVGCLDVEELKWRELVWKM
jgi:hypothetical protein